ncbi:MAG: hypothetical protein EKK37_17195 [Sphingobacteriales bacterium]|nr:MAG: hypothetical protein EKK37_17195 [Sphingobacteriales bacterium]
MTSYFIYLIKVTVCSGIFYGYYHFVLRNKKFHYWNRYYLLIAVMASLIIPFFHIPLSFSHEQVHQSPVLQTLNIISESGGENLLVDPAKNVSALPQLSSSTIILMAYLVVCLVTLIRFVKSIIKIHRLIADGKVQQMEDVYFINSTAEGTPFSFFRYIFWNKNIPLDTQEGKQIFKHELTHVHERHSYDKIFMQLVTVIYWCNPFFHIIKKELALIHEFIADHIASMNEDAAQYAEMILWKATTGKQLSFTNNFFYEQLKRRIAMITTSKQPSHQYLRKIMVLPLVIILIAAFAFRYKSLSPAFLKAEKPITIVIDAGHGGDDDGAIGENGLKEKNLTLEIAQTMKAIAKEKNITVLMSREGDSKVPLRERSDIANNNNADAVISIHVEAIGPGDDKEKYDGFEIFISKPEFPNREQSKQMAESIQNNITSLYKFNGIKTRQIGIWMAQSVNCPSVIMGCGYITNKKDAQFISNKENQKKVATAILDGVIHYLNKKKLGTDASKAIDSFPKSSFFADTKNKIVFFSDSIINKEKEQKDWGLVKTVYILNGETKEIAELTGKVFKCNSIISYPPNDDEARKNYGVLANNSIMIIDGAKYFAQYKSIFGQNPIVQKPTDDDGPVFTKTEVAASFPGGEVQWEKYVNTILNNFNANLILDKNSNGTLRLQFMVTKDGTLKNVKALNMQQSKLAEVMSNALVNGPKWMPAKQNGIAVNCYYETRVRFDAPGDIVSGYEPE